jgi:hypothetical protein
MGKEDCDLFISGFVMEEKLEGLLDRSDQRSWEEGLSSCPQ